MDKAKDFDALFLTTSHWLDDVLQGFLESFTPYTQGTEERESILDCLRVYLLWWRELESMYWLYFWKLKE